MMAAMAIRLMMVDTAVTLESERKRRQVRVRGGSPAFHEGRRTPGHRVRRRDGQAMMARPHREFKVRPIRALVDPMPVPGKVRDRRLGAFVDEAHLLS